MHLLTDESAALIDLSQGFHLVLGLSDLLQTVLQRICVFDFFGFFIFNWVKPSASIMFLSSVFYVCFIIYSYVVHLHFFKLKGCK